MDEIQSYRDAENEAFGRFLMDAVALRVGLERGTSAKDIDRAIYNGTDCGAWVRFDELGIMVGSIVEGSDAKFSERIDVSGVEYDEAGENAIADRVFAALDRIEDAVDEVWHEANEG